MEKHILRGRVSAPRWLPCAVYGLFLVVAPFAYVGAQTAVPLAPGHATGRLPDEARASYAVRVTTRLVTFDLLATDAHGNAVRDLKPEELQVFEEGRALQKIERLGFLQSSPSADSLGLPAVHDATNLYTNQFSSNDLKSPPTVLLMDGLNTQFVNQLQARSQMLKLLKNIPADAPVAVLLLGNSLRMVQGFTNDRSALNDAIDRAATGGKVELDSRDDPDGSSNLIQNLSADLIGDMTNFQEERYANNVDLRARQTTDALTSIARYLSGIPGRKNLIWVSESFPIFIGPGTGANSFSGLRDYSDEVNDAANALTDAQVAVYSMNVLGLLGRLGISGSGPGVGPVAGPRAGLQQSQWTMDVLSHDTGGKACKSTDDLAGCVALAVKDASAYYELSFYPDRTKWDGKFHKIELKTSRPGVKLVYRAGYYAYDASSLAKKQSPEQRLQAACNDLLPSTGIAITARLVPSDQPAGAPEGLNYLLTVSAGGLISTPSGDSHAVSLWQGACEFAQKSDAFRFYDSDLSKTVPDPVFQKWLAEGLPDKVTLHPAENTRRIRIVVLDGNSGLTGAIDIRLLPADIAKAATIVVKPAYLEVPDKSRAPAPPKFVQSLNFIMGAESGSLDWSGDAVKYIGGAAPEKAAVAFSNYLFGDRFKCEAGQFVPVDPADRKAILKFAFHNPLGKVVVVDVNGEHPEYSGSLPVDQSAKSLFDQISKTSHCLAQ